MKFNVFFKWLIKAAVACVIAFAVVSGGCVLYYNIPVHFANETGATDYKWEKSKFYSRGTEGFALGRTDSDGFNNKENPNGRTVDILFTGTSHGEGYNVSQNKICVSRLNDLFGDDMFAYNIATAGHSFPYLCRNLDAALSLYKPAKYVIMECQSVELKADAVAGAIDGTLPRLKSESGGIIGMLQKVPYLRLMYLQLSNIRKGKDDEDSSLPLPENPDIEYSAALETLIEKVKATTEKHNVTPIIIYHPHFTVEGADKIIMLHREKYVDIFKKTCDKNDITFVNMEDDFIKAYEQERKIPYGFSNTAIGEGHMNSYGHRLLAQRIYETIEDMEEAK